MNEEETRNKYLTTKLGIYAQSNLNISTLTDIFSKCNKFLKSYKTN